MYIWKIGKGDASFWWDNWTNLAPIAKLSQNQRTPEKTMVKDLCNDDTWIIAKLRRILPQNVINSIITIQFKPERQHLPIRNPELTRKFISKSANLAESEKEERHYTC